MALPINPQTGRMIADGCELGPEDFEKPGPMSESVEDRLEFWTQRAQHLTDMHRSVAMQLEVRNLEVQRAMDTLKPLLTGHAYSLEHAAQMAVQCANDLSDSLENKGQAIADLLERLNPFEEIIAERSKQDAQWGGPEDDDSLDPRDWIGCLQKQIGKALTELLAVSLKGTPQFRECLVKIAALAVAALESYDRKEGK